MPCHVTVTTGQDSAEFLAANAGNDVTVAQFAAQDISKADEHHVTVSVAEMVVDLLEAIEIEHDHGQAGRRRVVAEGLEQGTPVEDAGQRIGIGLHAMPSGSAGMVQGQRDGANTGQADQRHDGVDVFGQIVGWPIEDPLPLYQQHDCAGEEGGSDQTIDDGIGHHGQADIRAAAPAFQAAKGQYDAGV